MSGARIGRVVVAGASGFVGEALGPVLAKRFEVVGLSRSDSRLEGSPYAWRRCDMFSLHDVERALEGADFAVYLVHSMMPSSRLTQGRFGDLDVLAAANFAKAARAAGVRHIVYLSGLIPQTAELSEHLASRLEVERVLASGGVPVTTLRAGLIIGAKGSSYQIMVRLVRRLPAMVCPTWTSTLTQPVALSDVVSLIEAALGDDRLFGRSFDVGVREVMTYREMMHRTAALLGLERPMFGVPLLSPRLSRLWLSLITGAPRELAAPLVESLSHPMVARDLAVYELLGKEPMGFDEAIAEAVREERTGLADKPRAFAQAAVVRVETARSVQRVPLPADRDAQWAASEYVRSLPGLAWPFIRGESRGGTHRYYLRGVRRPLLVLEHVPERSTPERQLFHVTGGLLSHPEGRGRLELRQIPGEEAMLCAVHDFRPSLPRWLYLATQARAHRIVVARFGARMRRERRRGGSLRPSLQG